MRIRIRIPNTVLFGHFFSLVFFIFPLDFQFSIEPSVFSFLLLFVVFLFIPFSLICHSSTFVFLLPSLLVTFCSSYCSYRTALLSFAFCFFRYVSFLFFHILLFNIYGSFFSAFLHLSLCFLFPRILYFLIFAPKNIYCYTFLEHFGCWLCWMLLYQGICTLPNICFFVLISLSMIPSLWTCNPALSNMQIF